MARGHALWREATLARAEEIARDFYGRAHVAGLEVLDLAAHSGVQARQRVEWERGVRMMFGVVRHVPREQLHQRPRERRARVLETVTRERTTGVLGEQIRPQECLPDHPRDDPYHERRRRAERDRDGRDRQG